MISIREGVTKEIVDIMVFIIVNDNNDYTNYSVLMATRGAHNPNVQVAITVTRAARIVARIHLDF